jgi:hypothetical protein
MSFESESGLIMRIHFFTNATSSCANSLHFLFLHNSATFCNVLKNAVHLRAPLQIIKNFQKYSIFKVLKSTCESVKIGAKLKYSRSIWQFSVEIRYSFGLIVA